MRVGVCVKIDGMDSGVLVNVIVGAVLDGVEISKSDKRKC